MRSNRVDYEGIEAKILPKYPSLTFTTDGDSRDEYLHYISFQKPFYMLILSNIFTTLLSILAIMSSISYSNEGQDYGKLVFLSDISVGLICITPFIGWILLYHQIIGHHHPQKNIFITWIHQHYELLQFIHLNSMILSYALRLIQRSFTGQCQTLSKPLVDGWNCNPYANFNGFPLDTTLILMLTPFIFTASFREMNIFTYLTAWIITSVSLIVSVMAIGSTRLIAIIVPYIFFSAGIIMDNRKKNTLLFYMTKHIHEHMGSLDQDLSGSSTNQHLHPHPHHHGHQHVGSNHQKGNIVDNPDMMLQEMRYMIGNVAHDLKTVSIS